MVITDRFIRQASQRAVLYPPLVMRVSGLGPNLELDGTYPWDPPVFIHQIDSRLKVRKVSRSAGNASPDFAHVEWLAGGLINRRKQPQTFVALCEVLLLNGRYVGDSAAIQKDPSADAFEKSWDVSNPSEVVRLLLGDYVTESEAVDQTELLTGQIGVMDVHYGRSLSGPQVLLHTEDPASWDPYAEMVVAKEIVFNPMIDGVIRGNKSSQFDSPEHYWIDPEVADSIAAQEWLRQTVSLWSLPEAIHRLCWACNPDEDLIRNPVVDEEDALWTDAPSLQNVRFEAGHYLPYYLDALLQPHGYNWWLDPDTGATVNTVAGKIEMQKPIIRIFRKGWSPNAPKELHFQAPGSDLDLSQSNLIEYRIDRKISDAYNAVRVIGDRIRVEMTLPLYPGWRVSEDALTVDGLSIAYGESYKDHKTAHRLWINNEWSGFTGNREGGPYEVAEPISFNDFFLHPALGVWGDTQFRKRVLEPPLTFQGFGDKRVRRDILLEYSVDSGETWQEVSSAIGSWSALADQIGILFTDDKPPEVIVEAFGEGTLRMRVTGTVASDHHLHNGKTDVRFGSASVLWRERRLTIDKSEEFCLWYVLGRNAPRESLNASPYASVLKDDVAGADTRDDSQALVDFAAATLRNVQHAEYDGTFLLPGFHTEYQIGDLLSGISGRDVGLNQSADPENPRYMQITSIEWEWSDEEGPTTRLIVDRGVHSIKKAESNEHGPMPLNQVVAFQVEDILRRESARMNNTLNVASAAAIDRLRGVR